MPLTSQHRQEALSRVYVRAVAASAGANIAVPEHDYGIDFTLSEVVERNDKKNVRYVQTNDVNLQLKCSSRLEFDEGIITYDLESKSYNDLVMETVSPLILVVVDFPEKEAEGIVFSEDCLVMRKCAYYVSLRGKPPTDNVSTKRIEIPVNQIFDPESLKEIFRRVREGQAL